MVASSEATFWMGGMPSAGIDASVPPGREALRGLAASRRGARTEGGPTPGARGRLRPVTTSGRALRVTMVVPVRGHTAEE